MQTYLNQFISYISTFLTNTVNNGAICYVLAILVLVPTWFEPQMLLNSRVKDTLFILDISESMNVRDVNYPTPHSSRLKLAKQSIIASMAALPCGSRSSIGLMAGEESVVLFEPIEVCRHFPAIHKMISGIDRHARWVGDSKITDVTIKAIAQAKQRNLNLVLITDGDETPRRASLYMTKLATHRGKINGLLLGVGGDVLQPIPKLNAKEEVTGYWSREDAVTHGNYPELVAYTHAIARGEAIPDDAFDSVTEHVSAFNKTIMESISKASGFEFKRVRKPDDAVKALNETDFQRLALAERDARWIYGLIAIGLVLLGWFWPVLAAYRLKRFALTQSH